VAPHFQRWTPDRRRVERIRFVANDPGDIDIDDLSKNEEEKLKQKAGDATFLDRQERQLYVARWWDAFIFLHLVYMYEDLGGDEAPCSSHKAGERNPRSAGGRAAANARGFSVSFIRINDLAHELDVKSKSVLDYLCELGVSENKTHSSAIEEELADKVRAHFHALASDAGRMPRVRAEMRAQTSALRRASFR
jgi:hypothetical protein